MIKRIGYIILSFFLTRVLFIGTGFNTIINLSKNSLLLSSLIGMIIGLCILYFLYKKENINKYIVCIIAIFILIIISLTNVSLVTNYLLVKTPIWVVLFTFMFLGIYGSSKNMITTSRLSTIIILPTILLIIASLWGLSSLVEFNNLLPLLNANIINFFIACISFAALSIVPNILLLNYKNNLSFKTVSLGYIIGSLFLITIMFYIISIYGFELSSISKFPEYLILKKVFIVSNINNTENILLLEWISCIIVTCLVCMNVLRDNLSKKVFYLFMMLLIVFILLLLHRLFYIIILIQNYSNYIYMIMIILTLLFPCKKRTYIK